MPVSKIDPNTLSPGGLGAGKTDSTAAQAWQAALAPLLAAPPPAGSAVAPPVPAPPQASAAPPSKPECLVSDTPSQDPANCLSAASATARPGQDNIIFLSNRAPASGGVGHVVVQEKATGQITDPEALTGQRTVSNLSDYINQAKAGGHDFSLAGSASSGDVRKVLSLPQDQRAGWMAQNTSQMGAIAMSLFASDMPAPGQLGLDSAKAPPPPDSVSLPNRQPVSVDKAVHAWLNALGNAVPDGDKKELAQTGDDTVMMLQWFDQHHRGDPDIKNKASDEVNQAWNQLLASDSVKSQVVNDKGEMTRDKLSDFAGRLDAAAKAATDSYGKFTRDNKTPDAIAQQSAVDASTLQANLPIVDSAAPSSKIDQKFDKADLNSIVSGNGNIAIPEPLKRAAAFFAYAGQFSPLSNAGLNPGVDSKGVVQNSNFDTLLSKGTSKSEDDSITSLRSTAIKQAIQQAGGDASKVGKNYFTGGGTSANGADKAAAMIQLGETLGRFKSGQAAYADANVINPSTYEGEGPSPGQQRDDFVKGVQSRIDALAKDTDTHKFLGEKMPPALQGIVAGDPALKDAMQKKLDDLSGSKALQTAFDQKGTGGKSVSTTEALNIFGTKPSFYAQALSVRPDLTKALKDAPQGIKDKVNSGFDDICSGRDTAGMVSNGVPPDQAVMKSAVSKTAYDSVLDPNTVAAGTNKFNDVAAKYGRDQITDGKSTNDIFKGLGVANADDPALRKFIEDNLNVLSPKDVDQAKPIDIVLVVRGMSDMMRGGAKFDDSMAKIQKDWKSFIPGPVSDNYKLGVMHAASGLMLAGTLGARSATGNKGSDMQTAAQSLTVAGSLTEGGSKYYSSKLSSLKQILDDDKARLGQTQTGNIDYQRLVERIRTEGDNLKSLQGFGKDAENVGKSVGGVAGNALGLISGAISAKNAAASGDKTGAGIQGTVAGLNGVSSILGAGEIAAYVVPRIATALGAPLAEGALATLAGVGAGLGAAGGVVGGIAGAGILMYSIIAGSKADDKKNQQRDQWYSDMSKQFSSFGVQVPDIGIVTAPSNFTPDPAGNLMPTAPG